MKDRIFEVLQRIGKSFMLPVAILPAAGLLLGLGSSFTNKTTITAYHLEWLLGAGTLLHALLVLMNEVGSAIFDNLPLIFAVGVAIGMAKKEKEVAALAALIAFFVMHVSINGMLLLNGMILENGSIAAEVLDGTIASVCGIQTLQMGVFGGIIVGLGTAALHNRFYQIRLPDALSFFGGSRFVPIIATFVYLFVGIVMYFIWPAVQNLCSRKSGDRHRIFRYADFWCGEAGADSIWPASRFLHAVLADGRRRYDGGRRKAGAGRAEYFLCPACRCGGYHAFQCRCNAVFFR